MAREDIQFRYTSSGADAVVRDQRNIADSTDNVGTKFTGLGTAATSAKALMTGAAATMAVRVGTDLARIGVDLDLLEQRVGSVFGSGADDVRAWADMMASEFGTSGERAAGMAASLGDLLVPMGATREEAARLSMDAVEVASALDLWSGATGSTEEALDKISRALLGEREGLKLLGIGIDQARIDSLLLANGWDDLEGDARRLAIAQVTLNEIMNQSADALAFAGDEAAETQLKVRELESKWADLKDELGQRFLPVAEGVVDFLLGAADGADKFGDAVNSLPGMFSPAIAELKAMKDAVEALAGAIETTWTKLQGYVGSYVTSPPETDRIPYPATGFGGSDGYAYDPTTGEWRDKGEAPDLIIPPQFTAYAAGRNQMALPRAMGGLTPATRGGQLLVAGEAGEDEYTIPSARLHGLYGGGGGGATTINVNVSASGDGRAIADTVVAELEKWQRRNANVRRYELGAYS